MNRPTMRELSDARHRKRRDEMHAAIAEGRLTVRQMTPQERKQADLQRAARVRELAGTASSR
ncbi:MAG: hypothetical protein ACJ75R_11895 [Solirubrobacterales bacterium]